VDIGNVVAANTGSLLVIERLDPIYADFTITENDLTAVQRNMRDGTLRVEVRLPDEPKKPRDGNDLPGQRFRRLAGEAQCSSNSDHYFWPGRFVKSSF
jgi:multidrug efflux system membrane fusion protein